LRRKIDQTTALRRDRASWERVESRPADPDSPASAAMTRTALFAPFEIIEGARDRGMVLVADHARRDLPEEYGSLGLPASEFERHIAYDIGVEAVTRRLAALTGAPAVIANFSRLLIDPNRGEDDPTLIRQLYDGTIVPGNYPISAEEREKRLDRFYRPYHDAVASMIASVAAASEHAPFVFSVHSFTPRMQGIARPWHVGVLWDRDDRAVRPLLDMLSADPALVVGDNEPYDGALRGDTMYQHCIVNGFAHALIEIRQDLIADEAGQEEWAQRLAPMLDAINARPDIHEVKRFGSRTGPVPSMEIGR
jgi:predicted N-formylglutamate amidohydrolase